MGDGATPRADPTPDQIRERAAAIRIPAPPTPAAAEIDDLARWVRRWKKRRRRGRAPVVTPPPRICEVCGELRHAAHFPTDPLAKRPRRCSTCSFAALRAAQPPMYGRDAARSSRPRRRGA